MYSVWKHFDMGTLGGMLSHEEHEIVECLSLFDVKSRPDDGAARISARRHISVLV